MIPGDIYFHRDFVFPDGAIKDKYLVVLGGAGSTLIMAKTTSKGHRYRLDYGCQSANRFPAFYLPKGSCCLKHCTWICLNEFYEINLPELQSKMLAGQVYGYGKIGGETRTIQFCAIGCDDISKYQEDIIRSSLASP